MKTKKVSNLELLKTFGKNESIENLKASTVRVENSGLSKVFNNGMGLIEVAIKTDTLVIYNSLCLSKVEHTELSKINSAVFIEYGYPDYYNNNLRSFYTKSQKLTK
jgi:hypothetical protein